MKRKLQSKAKRKIKKQIEEKVHKITESISNPYDNLIRSMYLYDRFVLKEDIIKDERHKHRRGRPKINAITSPETNLHWRNLRTYEENT